ncbi:PREDICTED: LOC18774466 [Prunus dulcis]|uniref:PREDICTED: LOC18774466 n=1 Tax=Prunus dulcis TaxID=3755 RepID=A0A5E4G4C2_PRUDU|nr:PREDICTED: LOC18774466 [Prunus dulcis]
MLCPLWLALWKAGVPTKSKCSGEMCARLTKHNLSKKQVSLDPTCVFCGGGYESTIHLLRDYIFAEDFLNVNTKAKFVQQPIGEVKLEKPKKGHLKVNVDDAWHTGSTLDGLGIIVRNSEGTFVAGCPMVVDNVSYAAHVEALDARLGISLAVERGFMNVSFESDALKIV